MRRLKAVRRQNILVDENIYGGMAPDELCRAQEKELQMAQQDIKMERTKEKKNALEAYVYETRNKVQTYFLLVGLYSYVVFFIDTVIMRMFN